MSKFSISKVFISTLFIYSSQSVMIFSMQKQGSKNIDYKRPDIITQKSLDSYFDPNKNIVKNKIKSFDIEKLEKEIKNAESIKDKSQMLVDLGNEIYISIYVYLRLLKKELIVKLARKDKPSLDVQST